jgi:hypothetical protein
VIDVRLQEQPVERVELRLLETLLELQPGDAAQLELLEHRLVEAEVPRLDRDADAVQVEVLLERHQHRLAVGGQQWRERGEEPGDLTAEHLVFALVGASDAQARGEAGDHLEPGLLAALIAGSGRFVARGAAQGVAHEAPRV